MAKENSDSMNATLARINQINSELSDLVDSDDLELITNLSSQRDAEVKLLFSSHSADKITEYTEQLNTLHQNIDSINQLFQKRLSDVRNKIHHFKKSQKSAAKYKKF